MPSILTGLLSSLPFWTTTATATALTILRSRFLSSPALFTPLPALANSPLLTVFALDFGIQAAFYAHALTTNKSEKLYDLSGSLTYLACFAYSFMASGVYDPKQFLATAAGCLWAARLGGYLFERIQREGKDERFDNLKSSAGRFAIPWAMQAVWVGAVGAPIYLINTLPATPVTATSYVGVALWTAGFLIEAISDRQKDVFKREKPKEFINTGLWSWSRHPNYVGEILLQSGLFVYSLSCLTQPWHYLLAFSSPLLSYLLLTKVSGIPMLEPEAKKKYGAKWEEYCKKVPVLFPWSKA